MRKKLFSMRLVLSSNGCVAGSCSGRCMMEWWFFPGERGSRPKDEPNVRDDKRQYRAIAPASTRPGGKIAKNLRAI
jgi:hypothetical protein